MELVEYPSSVPGSCKICGSASKSPFIDTGSYEEFHGAIYYCHECAGEMARLLNFLHPADYQSLVGQRNSLEEELFKARLRIDGLEKAIDGLAAARGFNIASVDELVSFLYTSKVANEGTSSGEANVGSGAGETFESSEQPGLADVLSTDEQSEDFKLSI